MQINVGLRLGRWRNGAQRRMVSDSFEALWILQRIAVPHEKGGHFGGDTALQKMLFGLAGEDPLGQRAGTRAGAVSVLCGVAATESMDKPAKLGPLLERAAVRT